MTADPLTIVHEPDAPALWVVYRGCRRVSQHETREAAAAWVSSYGGGAERPVQLYDLPIFAWAWQGDARDIER